VPRVRRFLVAAALLSSCTGELTVEPPPMVEGMRSELMIVDEGEAARYVLIDSGQVLFSVPAKTPVRWLQLASDAETLGVAPGVLPVAPDPSRFVPSPLPEVLATHRRGDDGAWSEDPSFEAPLGRLFGHDCGERLDPPAPTLPECPRWTTVEGDHCAVPARPDCPEGQVRFGLDTECTAHGNECPAEPWPTDLPSGVVYLDAAAAAGGDGSLALPFGTLDLAIDSGAPAIAIAAGSYDTRRSPITAGLYGHCAQDTRLRTRGAELRGGLHGVTIIDESTFAGPEIERARFDAKLEILPGRYSISDSTFGGDMSTDGATVALDGVVFTAESTLSCTRGQITATRLAGARIDGGGCDLRFEDSSLRRSVDTASGAVSLARSYVRGQVHGPGRIVLADVWVDTRGSLVGMGVFNINMETYASDLVSQSEIHATRQVRGKMILERAFLDAPGMTDSLDAELDWTDIHGDTRHGVYEVLAALSVQSSVLSATRIRVVGRGQPGLSIRDSEVHFTDLTLESFGFGIFSIGTLFGQANPGEHLELDRFVIQDCGTAVVLTPAGTIAGRDGAFRRNGRWLEACNNPRAFTRVEVDQCVDSTCNP
jgi:hypothetical protein